MHNSNGAANSRGMLPSMKRARPSGAQSFGRPRCKVGIVIGSLGRGGTETHLSQVLPELATRGYDVSVFVMGPFGPVAAELVSAHVKLVPEQPIGMPQREPALMRRLLRYVGLTLRYLLFAFRHRHGVLHFFLPHAMIFGGLLTIGWHRRLIASQRGMLGYRAKRSAFMIWLERMVRRRMSLVLANSGCVARLLTEDGAPANRVTIVRSGLSDARMSPVGVERGRLRAELGIAPGTFVILTLANLFPYKGHADLLTALGSLHANRTLGEDWMLVCVGRDIAVDGREVAGTKAESNQRRLQRLAKGLDLQTHVRFLGERNDAPALLRIADLATLPSHEEGFSNALIEKMAAGLPIVATAVGGNIEALEDGRLGVLVPAHDPAALAAAIARMFHSPQKRAELGALACARALADYHIQQCVDGYEVAYSSLFASQKQEQSPGRDDRISTAFSAASPRAEGTRLWAPELGPDDRIHAATRH